MALGGGVRSGGVEMAGGMWQDVAGQWWWKGNR